MTATPRPEQAHAKERRELIDSYLPAIVDGVLDEPEIAEGVVRAGLDRDQLRRQAVAAENDVLAPTESQLTRAVERVVVLHLGRRRSHLNPRLVTATGIALIVLPVAVVLGWPDLPWWVMVPLLTVSIGVMTFASGMYIRLAVMSNRVALANLAIKQWQEVCRTYGVQPFVRRVINRHFDPVARTSMAVTDAPGLRGVSEASYVVRTSSVDAFLTAARGLPSGAIGIAGPRGVGKTSLIEYFAGLEDDGHRPLKVTVAAPVQYEPRDFVLHLFATVCQAVLRDRGTPLRRRFLGGVRGRDGGVAALATQHLQNIRYLQTHTTGWSGKLALPMSSEAGWSRTAQRERRAQTYPELVATLCEFLAAYAAEKGGSPAMIIAVDELDKIGSAERAQQFVNEIKSIFGAAGTQFLVSVSEDALAAFERRGMPVRDAFDSAFHEIVRVDYLTIADTAQLLSSRVIGLPEPFTWLVHCMSGGLPRDVVRTARAMVALADQPPPSLDDVCAALVDDDLRRKSHAFQLACRELGDDPDVTTFIRTLRRLPAGEAQLLTLVPELRMGELGRQAAAYVYYSATLLEVFTRDRVDARDSATFDSLARAKQSLAVHPRLAWLLVDEFRDAWGLPTVPAD